MAGRTVYALLEETAKTQKNTAALHQPAGGGHRIWTWLEYRDAAREIALGLHAMGVRRGEIVALYSETRAEFYLADIGVMAAGAVAAALYTSYPLPDQVRNLQTAEVRVIFVENPKSMRGLKDSAGDAARDWRWILMTGEADGVLTLDALREEGRRALEREPGLFERIEAGYSPDDYAILYLTSGATGEPKMGLVTHRAVVSNLDVGPGVLPIGPGDSTIVFLPSAHIAQRVVLELLPLRMGVPVWFSESLSKLPAELRTIRPTFLLAPPRVWERIYASVCTEIRKRPAIARRLFYAGIGLGSDASNRERHGRTVPGWMRGARKFFDRAVYSKIRERLGGRIRIAASGAAPLGKDLAEFYAAIGMPLIEGYGLTEGGIVSFNPLNRPKPASIGTLLPGVEAKLAEDGELLVRSPYLFSGYYKDPHATALVLRDGWLSTGDIAEFDADGYLYITGRKKELIVSSNGKKIYPSRIEGLFKTEPLINQVLLIGDRLPYVTALFTINRGSAEALRGMESYKLRPPAEIAAAPAVDAEIRKAVARANKKLPAFEQIRKFRILEREFTIEAGELTPTMKVRRSRVLENYRAVIGELYMGKEVD
ncbi:MAG: long-chain fatty acid--CoA ligase [Bryobacteraceae bacterium]